MARIRSLGLAGLVVTFAACRAPADDAALEQFEKEVRPLLATRCQGCHGPTKQKGGLRLDSRPAMLAGGDTGPAVVPGKPGESLLVDAINYGEQVRMPPKSKLPPAEIAVLTKWVASGAAWPEESSGRPPGTAVAGTSWKDRANHWSFRPIRRAEPPAVRDASWAWGEIDRFLLAGLEAKGLKPAADADRRAWIRRVTFDLICLPPRPDEVEAFVADRSPGAFENVADRLLASPRYGERWGRHWLDLVRYAETSGHEFDYAIPDAWRYRDYVIRALNADVPYDQFVVEHLAGDLLPEPRRHPKDGTNESVLATGFYFLGEGTHSPVDLRDEEAGRIDGQIDVLGKAFLGLTLACARCHDHKFDAITTKDYYALSGYLKSSRLQHAFLDPPARDRGKIDELGAIRRTIAERLGDRCEHSADSPSKEKASEVFEDFGGFADWSITGDAFGENPTKGCEIRVSATASMASPVPPGWAHSGLVSDRLQGVLRSRTFAIDKRYALVRAQGKGGRINLVIDGFEKNRDPIYGGLTKAVDSPEVPQWYVMDLAMWRGHRAYFELADGAVVDFTTGLAHLPGGDGFLAVDEIRLSDDPSPPADRSAGPRPKPVALDAPEFKPLLERYRAIESTIAPPALGLAILDGTSEDARVNIRGNPKTPGDVVPRRFLEVFGSPSPTASGSGRLELARRLVDPGNPFVARVIVNRLWKGHFGVGLVPTPDDFGAMGTAPTHPELLDWLASEFVRDGWSIKRMHRRMVLSHAYRMISTPDPVADRDDPNNRLLHRMNARRLEAEAVRDAMLAVSGRLDASMFGPSVPTHLTPFMEGRGRPSSSGPLDGAGRRTIYLEVRRNFPAPMLLAFDFPTLPSCIGRRNVSNVPAQALTLLNDPFVLGQARAWAEREAKSSADASGRVDDLYRAAFGRPPSDLERAEALAFVSAEARKPDEVAAWADLCHVLLNTKEFLFIP